MNNFQHSSTFINNDDQDQDKKDKSQEFKLEEHGTNLNEN